MVSTAAEGKGNEKPRKRCLIVSQATVDANLEEIDDTQERTSRNLLRIMDEASKFGSPVGTPDRYLGFIVRFCSVSKTSRFPRRQFVSSAGMTNAQIAEHYTSCLKLSAENVRCCYFKLDHNKFVVHI